MKFKINSGEFKHPIQILRKGTGIKDEDGIIQYPLEVLFSTKAKILNVSGKEFIQAQGDNARISKKMYIRYNKNFEITEDDIISFNNIKYNIKYLNNIEEANIYLEILVEVVK